MNRYSLNALIAFKYRSHVSFAGENPRRLAAVSGGKRNATPVLVNVALNQLAMQEITYLQNLVALTI